MRFTLVFIFVMLATSFFGSNISELNDRFIHFYLKGNMVSWKHTVDSLRSAPRDAATERVLLFAEYGLIGNYIGSGKKDEAEDEISIFENRIERVLKSNPLNGELYAFSAALVAYRIALSPWRAPFLGPSHTQELEKAVRFSSAKGLPLVEQANSLFFRPAFVGGDKKLAVDFYKRAFNYYKNSEPNHWMYFNVGAWLAQAYAQTGEIAKAEELYLQLLQQAPDFIWVRDELLPELRQGNISNNFFLDF